MSEIVLSHIDKYYGANHVLKDVSFTVHEGDFLTLLGPSGCGKTTMLRVIAGLENPQKGTITIDGKEVVNADNAYYMPPSGRGLNLVFQSYALWPHMTVWENVAFVMEVKKTPKKTIDEMVRQALEKMQISQFAQRYPSELSGGQQQRVAIARALAMKPEILFFDEPTSALDPELTGEILKVIRQLAQEKMTMVIVTHEMAFARDVADRVIFMDGGVIVEQGDPKEVIGSPKEERTRQFLARFAN